MEVGKTIRTASIKDPKCNFVQNYRDENVGPARIENSNQGDLEPNEQDLEDVTFLSHDFTIDQRDMLHHRESLIIVCY